MRTPRNLIQASSLLILAPWIAFGACAASDEIEEVHLHSPDEDGGNPDSGADGAVIEAGLGKGCGCSADLKQVLDCDGEELYDCPSDQACLSGLCAPDPCAVAGAARSTYGCQFWPLNLDPLAPVGLGGCYAAFVANTWDLPVHLEVERGGEQFDEAEFVRIPKGQGADLSYAPYDPVAGLPPGEIAVVFLSNEAEGASMMPRCPAPAAVKNSTSVAGTALGQAFSLRSTYPVVAYQSYPYGGGASAATSATLLLPESAWGNNYVAVSAYVSDIGDPSLNVVAKEDNTTITINPSGKIQGSTAVPPTEAGQPLTMKLDRGQFLQLTQKQDLSGSIVLADKDVGVFGGHTCLRIPVGTSACDTAQQQLPPVRALGHAYAAVSHKPRRDVVQGTPFAETYHFRMVGAVNGTSLSYLPTKPADAPDTLAEGQVVDFTSDGPFLVQSQDSEHPYYAAAYMTGAGIAEEPLAGQGDPEWVNLIPVDQYLERYVFFTDPTYPETHLTVVRPRRGGQFADVFIECGAEASAVTGWQPLDADHEYAFLTLVNGEFVGQGGCSNGRQVMRSTAPFGLTVWGWGSDATGELGSPTFSQFVSYAYPAGQGIRLINDVVVDVR